MHNSKQTLRILKSKARAGIPVHHAGSLQPLCDQLAAMQHHEGRHAGAGTGASGCHDRTNMPRLLSDNCSSYVAEELTS
jgi:hypothetical protein